MLLYILFSKVKEFCGDMNNNVTVLSYYSFAMVLVNNNYAKYVHCTYTHEISVLAVPIRSPHTIKELRIES